MNKEINVSTFVKHHFRMKLSSPNKNTVTTELGVCHWLIGSNSVAVSATLNLIQFDRSQTDFNSDTQFNVFRQDVFLWPLRNSRGQWVLQPNFSFFFPSKYHLYENSFGFQKKNGVTVT